MRETLFSPRRYKTSPVFSGLRRSGTVQCSPRHPELCLLFRILCLAFLRLLPQRCSAVFFHGSFPAGLPGEPGVFPPVSAPLSLRLFHLKYSFLSVLSGVFAVIYAFDSRINSSSFFMAAPLSISSSASRMPFSIVSVFPVIYSDAPAFRQTA